MDSLPLDKNESYWLLDAELAAAAAAAQDAATLSRYPDYTDLTSAVAAYAGVRSDQVLVTPGSDAAIEHVARAFSGNGRKAVLPVPTFYGYESILARVGAAVTPVTYREEGGAFIFPTEETLAAARDAAAVLLCQPNNPLGCPIPEDAMGRLLDASTEHGFMLICDEAYYEFSGHTLLPSLDGHPNLIVLRTLSKGFGLSGARVGYALAAPAQLAQLKALMLPWPVAAGSAAAALALLARAGEVKERRALVIESRERFRSALSGVEGLTAYPSETNFLLVRVQDAPHVKDELGKAGIRVALAEPMSRFPDASVLLHDCLRIAVPEPGQMELLLVALRASLQDR